MKNIILIRFPNEEREGWHYLAVKIVCIITKKTSKHKGDFYCLDCLNSFRTEKKRKSYGKACKIKDFCEIVMPSEKKK